MKKNYELSKEKTDALFNEIVPELFGKTDPKENPRLEIVVGQSGSGKDRFLKRMMQRESALRNAYRCDMTALRGYHPDKEEIVAIRPFEFSDLTTEMAAALRKKALSWARQNKRDVLLPMAPTVPSMRPDSLIASFRNAGYEVNMHCLAVPHLMSMVKMLERFERGYQIDETPPYLVSLGQHTVCYEFFPQKVAALAATAQLSSLRIYDQNEAVLYDRDAGVKEDVSSGKSKRFWISEMLHETDGFIRSARNRPWDLRTRQTFNQKCQEVLERYETAAEEKGGAFVPYFKEMKIVASHVAGGVAIEGTKADFRPLLERHMNPPFMFGY